jgi:hypothetical protein
MAAIRRLREVHELATQRHHRRNLARRQAHRARQAGDKGSNTVDLGWGDDQLSVTAGRGRWHGDDE